MKKIDFYQSRKKLLTHWIVASLVIFVTYFVVARMGRFGASEGEVWSWLFQFILPPLSLMIGVLIVTRPLSLVSGAGSTPLPLAGVGFGLGIERLLLLLQEIGVPVPGASPDVYAVLPDVAALPQAMVVLDALRSAGLAVQMHAGGGSLKAQFKKADASGARYALVFGADAVRETLRQRKAEQAAAAVLERKI